MKFEWLPQEDKKYLIEAFEKDGFTVVDIVTDKLVALKGSERIVLDKLDTGHFEFNFKKWLNKKNLLAKDLGGLDLGSLVSFLESEKKNKEDILDCLSRIAVKLNWAAVYSGKISEETYDGYEGHEVKILELETDDQSIFTLLKIKGHRDSYAVEMPAWKIKKLLLNFDAKDYLKELAPQAYQAIQAVGGV